MTDDEALARRIKSDFIRELAGELSESPDAYLLGLSVARLLQSGETPEDIHSLVDTVIDEIGPLLKKKAKHENRQAPLQRLRALARKRDSSRR